MIYIVFKAINIDKYDFQFLPSYRENSLPCFIDPERLVVKRVSIKLEEFITI